jgi:hypothetical protein
VICCYYLFSFWGNASGRRRGGFLLPFCYGSLGFGWRGSFSITVFTLSLGFWVERGLLFYRFYDFTRVSGAERASLLPFSRSHSGFGRREGFSSTVFTFSLGFRVERGLLFYRFYALTPFSGKERGFSSTAFTLSLRFRVERGLLFYRFHVLTPFSRAETLSPTVFKLSPDFRSTETHSLLPFSNSHSVFEPRDTTSTKQKTLNPQKDRRFYHLI